jgi:hypothetical protein
MLNFRLAPGNCLGLVSGGLLGAWLALSGSVPYGHTGMEVPAVLPVEKQSMLAAVRVASKMLENAMLIFNRR